MEYYSAMKWTIGGHNLDESQSHDEWKKMSAKGYRLYDSIYMLCSKRHTQWWRIHQWLLVSGCDCKGRAWGCFIGWMELFYILIQVGIKIIPSLLDCGVIHSSALVIQEEELLSLGEESCCYLINFIQLPILTHFPKLEYSLFQYYC